MTLDSWFAYVATVLLVVGLPGPSQLLMVSNTLGSGLRRSAATAAGDLSANLLQILAAGAGLEALVAASEPVFFLVKWCGSAYLVWLGVRRLAAAGGAAAPASDGQPRPLGSLWRDGFLTSAANPKAVLFFAALFPQFIQAEAAVWPQVAILGITFLLLDGSLLTLYGTTSSRLARRLSGTATRIVERTAGGLMVVAGLLLASRATR